MELHLTATERHLPYGITQYLLPATRHKWTHPVLTPARQVTMVTRFTYPEWMEGWVDLGDQLHTEIVYPTKLPYLCTVSSDPLRDMSLSYMTDCWWCAKDQVLWSWWSHSWINMIQFSLDLVIRIIITVSRRAGCVDWFLCSRVAVMRREFSRRSTSSSKRQYAHDRKNYRYGKHLAL